MDPFSDLLGIFGINDTRSPEQKSCTHLLASRMPDSKYFCPSCRYVSQYPMRKDECDDREQQ
jgi:hypothetical protein